MKLLCRLLGHDPEGPVQTEPIRYRCRRCGRILKFRTRGGWREA